MYFCELENAEMNGLCVNKLHFLVVVSLGLLAASTASAGIVDFEDLQPATPYSGPGGGYYWNGADGAGGFTSGGVRFSNAYNTSYGNWDGWSYANTTDTQTAGYTNQYSAFAGSDHSEPGANYGVYYESWSLAPTVTLQPGANVLGMWITNTTYTALSLRDGDQFAKKFGGDSGNDADWFLLTITGEDSLGTRHSVDFWLADYRFSDNTRDYIVDTWTWVDLTPLGDARELTFDLSSSDTNEWGMNTPASFALDDLVVATVPEPAACVLLGTGGLLVGALLVRRRRQTGRQTD